MSDRTYAQGLQDDEDHRLALCGLTPDVRLDWELEDFAVRAHDFRWTPPGSRPVSVISGPTARCGCGGMETTPADMAPEGTPGPSEDFASGRRDPAPTMRSGLAAGRKRHNPRRSAASPPPL